MSFTLKTLQKIIASAAAKIEKKVDYLNQLDAATGDGDHGTAIKAAMQAANASAASAAGQLSDALSAIGWAVMSEASGSTSSLTGSFYTGMSEAASANAESTDTDGVIDMFAAALSAVQKSSRAKIGDKTLMDALIPAIEAMKSLKGTNADLKDVLRSAAFAANRGAESTKNLIAKHGRAKNLGDRSIGHIDAGATSLALIFDAFAEASAEI